MNTENQIKLLSNPEIEPTNEVIENVLGKNIFEIYTDILNTISKLDIQYEWRYYNDGKSWLFKATYKKKTVFWLSLWEGLIKTSFYFTEKNRQGISELSINKEIKENFNKVKTIGKLIPLIIDINKKEQLKDFEVIVKYKMSLK
ncbi:MAG: DUF3788 domain-containing protein [Bacteroidales bacterium]|jgi:hypothetical protein|nr:DUF3788 domain-containing protein [Bacteroidales bacterium]